jgi:hypothetical protein
MEFIEHYRGNSTGTRLQNSKDIAELSLMCQSYFGKQNGDFELIVKRISVYR